MTCDLSTSFYILLTGGGLLKEAFSVGVFVAECGSEA
jgi:hypothetical protein